MKIVPSVWEWCPRKLGHLPRPRLMEVVPSSGKPPQKGQIHPISQTNSTKDTDKSETCTIGPKSWTNRPLNLGKYFLILGGGPKFYWTNIAKFWKLPSYRQEIP